MRILKCPKCGKYTLKKLCCEKTISCVPPKYSPEDKYAKYRRKLKREILIKKGVL